MTHSPSMLPVSGEQHEKARGAGLQALDACYPVVPGDVEDAMDRFVAAYFASLAAQGVRLVDASGDHLVTLTVCARSGQLPHECGLVACDNGCETEDLEFVRVNGSAVEGVRLVDAREVAEWLDDQCGSARAHWFLARFGGGDA